VIIVLGMAGAGKSTQCRKLADTGEYRWVSIGELLRNMSVSAEHKAEMMMGKVLSDDIVTPIVESVLKLGDNPTILLDGCPRTTGQARWLVEQEIVSINGILHMVVDDEIALHRLLKRGRSDDTPEAMRKRFDGYHRDINSVLEIFEDAGFPVLSVDASKDEDEVFREIVEEIATL